MDTLKLFGDMTKEEMNQFLESIGGLENGFYTDRPPIMDANFFDISEGWYPLVKELIEDLVTLGWDKEVCQVKEKFGGLRFYINGGSDEIYKKILDGSLSFHNWLWLWLGDCASRCGSLAKPFGGDHPWRNHWLHYISAERNGVCCPLQ